MLTFTLTVGALEPANNTSAVEEMSVIARGKLLVSKVKYIYIYIFFLFVVLKFKKKTFHHVIELVESITLYI